MLPNALKSRRQFLELAAATGLTAATVGLWLSSRFSGAQAAESASVPVADLMAPGLLSDFPQGKDDAPCTIVEYASMTCPHCAAFHTETFPTLKSEYIDTGKVRFFMREFPLDPLATVGFMVARYAGDEKRNAVIDLLFSTQKTWAFGDKGINALADVMKQTGMTQAAFDTCLKDKDLYTSILKARDVAQTKFGVASTPCFFINGTRHAGGFDIAEMRKLVDPLVTKS